jgi:hypothetical protein
MQEQVAMSTWAAHAARSELRAQSSACRSLAEHTQQLVSALAAMKARAEEAEADAEAAGRLADSAQAEYEALLARADATEQDRQRLALALRGVRADTGERLARAEGEVVRLHAALAAAEGERTLLMQQLALLPGELLARLHARSGEGPSVMPAAAPAATAPVAVSAAVPVPSAAADTVTAAAVATAAAAAVVGSAAAAPPRPGSHLAMALAASELVAELQGERAALVAALADAHARMGELAHNTGSGAVAGGPASGTASASQASQPARQVAAPPPRNITGGRAAASLPALPPQNEAQEESRASFDSPDAAAVSYSLRHLRQALRGASEGSGSWAVLSMPQQHGATATTVRPAELVEPADDASGSTLPVADEAGQVDMHASLAPIRSALAGLQHQLAVRSATEHMCTAIDARTTMRSPNAHQRPQLQPPPEPQQRRPIAPALAVADSMSRYEAAAASVSAQAVSAAWLGRGIFGPRHPAGRRTDAAGSSSSSNGAAYAWPASSLSASELGGQGATGTGAAASRGSLRAAIQGAVAALDGGMGFLGSPRVRNDVGHAVTGSGESWAARTWALSPQGGGGAPMRSPPPPPHAGGRYQDR